MTSASLSVCLDYSIEPLEPVTSFRVYGYTFSISMSSLSTKVIQLRSRSNEQKPICHLVLTSTCLYSTEAYSKGEGHLKVKARVIEC